MITEEELLWAGNGRKLVFLGRAADMVSITLSRLKNDHFEYAIHITTDAEILLDGTVITETADMYREIQPNKTKYDVYVEKIMSMGRDYVLQSLSYGNDGCLYAQFSNGLEVRSIYTQLSAEPTNELWRVFYPWQALPHLVATENGVVLEECENSQEELDRILDLRKNRLSRKTEREHL